MKLVCASCDALFLAGPRTLRCEACGGPLQVERIPFRPQAIVETDYSLWRYRGMLPIEDGAPIVSMGEGMTPLVKTTFAGREVFFKLEYVAPTGSFKDRGTTVMMTKLREWNVSHVADDSSGNAGASLAAYAAYAGIPADVFVPARASDQKKTQIAIFGATLRSITGPRERAEEAVLTAVASSDLVYASHAWSPFVCAGTSTIAYELWEQLGRREPDCFVSPIGQGSLFLGAYRGFQNLLEAGLISRIPRMIGVQSEACAPIVQAVKAGQDRHVTIRKRPSIAEGIALAHPIHDREILSAIRTTDGVAVSVSDGEIQEAQSELAKSGFHVEPTSAVVGHALRKLNDLAGVVVIALTGTGLKSRSTVSIGAWLRDKWGKSRSLLDSWAAWPR